MRNFFGAQDSAKARSRLFYVAFSFAVAGAVVVLYFAVTSCFLVAGFLFPFREYQPEGWWHGLVQYSLPPLIYGNPKEIIALRPFLILMPTITICILLLSYYKIRLIKEGGGAYVARSMGGVLIGKGKNDDEKRLLNVVEEMSLASGLPCPRVFVMPKEPSINAITAGLNYEDAIIAVTAGSLKHLDRDELQGVIAHEYGHVLNGDYSLNLTMAGWLYGLLFFAVQGREMMMLGKILFANSEDGIFTFMIGLPMFLIGMIVWVGGSIGQLAAAITQAAMSRQREQMADAFAVQFTRNPRGLAGALKKIAAFPHGGLIKSGQALMMKSFFIASPSRLRGLLRSHPPLEDRILALEPSWDGSLPEFGEEYRWPVVQMGNDKLKLATDNFSILSKNPQQLIDEATKLDGHWVGTLVLGMLAGHVGRYDGAEEAMYKSLEISHRLYEKIPRELCSAIEDAEMMTPLISAVFISDDPEIRARQEKIIHEAIDPDNAALAVKMKAMMDRTYRLPILGLASPALMELSDESCQALGKLVTALVSADGKLDLFELAALQILKKRLKFKLRSAQKNEERMDSALRPDKYLAGVQAAVVVVMSALSHLGSRRASEEKQKEAFRAGMVHFNHWPNHWPAFEMLPSNVCSSRELMQALDHLGQTSTIAIRNSLVLAAVSTALHDNCISSDEYELLRALAAALDIPLPYFAA